MCFPLHSPLVESLEVTRYGSVRRAKLYYLRGLQGRAARIKELNPVQRRKAQEEAAAVAAELSDKIAAAEAESENLEVEEPADDVEEQPAEDVAETVSDEASTELADEPVAEEVLEEPAEAEPTEEAPPEELPEEESQAEKTE